MKQILTALLILCLSHVAQSQTTQYHLHIKSVKVDGKPMMVERLKTELFSFMISTGDKGAAMSQFIGEKVVETGKLELVSSKEHKETNESFAGYTVEYVWYPQTHPNHSSCRIKLRVVMANDGDHFKLLVAAGKDPVIEYDGDIKDVSG